MTASNPTYFIDFNVKFDKETDDHLEKLKTALNIPKSQIVRKAINDHFLMRFGRQPTCAHGESCRMPQAFSFPAPIPDLQSEPTASAENEE